MSELEMSEPQNSKASSAQCGGICTAQAATSPPTRAEAPHERQAMFERVGGLAGIDRLVESFYRRMEALPEARTIRALHPHDLSPTKAILKRYLTEWTGGPKLYSAEKGHPRLRRRHIGIPIDEAARDSWLLCMRGALAETISDEAVRDELDVSFSKLADWMRNQGDNPHDQQKRAAS